MSIYSHLSLPVPVIAYCTLHQALPDVSQEQYVNTMRQMHERIGAEARTIAEAYEQSIRDAIIRDAQLLRVSLAEFLHTLIKGDDEAVRKALAEGLERFRNELTGSVTIGVKDSVEGRLFFPTSKVAVEKRLLNAGRNYLEDLGIATARGNGDIFESMFIVHGSVNLDLLEHIVRDRIGIYADPHGVHIKEFGGYSYTAYNLVYAKGEMPDSQNIKDSTEAAIFFSKPGVKYAPFRKALADALDRLTATILLDHVTVWQRKLGLGTGKEFVLRMVSRSSEQLSGAISWLGSYKEKPEIHEAVVKQGKLVVKELLF